MSQGLPRFLLLLLALGCSNKPSGPGGGASGQGGGGEASQAGSGAAAATSGSDQGGSAAGAGPEIIQSPSRRLALGAEHGCAIDASGALACWGAPSMDNGQTHPPAGVFMHIRGYGSSSCAFDADSTFECWGTNFSYTSGSNAVDIGIATRHGCVLSDDGSVACKGEAGHPEIMPPDRHFRSVAAAPGRTCAIGEDSSMSCWGVDGGDGDLDVPTGQFSLVVIGDYHQCAIRKGDGGAVCWGAGKASDPNGVDPLGNYWGQSIAPAGSFRDLCAGLYHTCGVRSDGTLACWGLGTSTKNCATTGECGQAAPPTGKFEEVACGTTHTCAIEQGGTVVCWGSNTGDRATPPAGLQTL